MVAATATAATGRPPAAVVQFTGVAYGRRNPHAVTISPQQ